MEKYLAHSLTSPKDGCLVQTAQDKMLRDTKPDMDSGVIPYSIKNIVESPNRAVLRFWVAS